MGVAFRVTMYASTEQAAREAAQAVFSRINELEDKLSDQRPSSEVRLLAERPYDWQPVSDDLLRVLALSQEFSQKSGGAFDVTVGPFVQLWRESRSSGRLPTYIELSEAGWRSGPPLVEVDEDRGEVRLWCRDMRIDLGGIAKGYMLQNALAVLRAKGVRSAMIEAGGDLVVGDAPPGQPGWNVYVASSDTAMLNRARALKNAAVGTSGGSEQFVEIGGVRYSQVIDPRTGLGVTGKHIATVIADDAVIADAAATALNVLGPTNSAHFRRLLPKTLVSFRTPPAVAKRSR
jgi:thiamine biosynthesis lipoprotein